MAIRIPELWHDTANWMRNRFILPPPERYAMSWMTQGGPVRLGPGVSVYSASGMRTRRGRPSASLRLADVATAKTNSGGNARVGNNSGRWLADAADHSFVGSCCCHRPRAAVDAACKPRGTAQPGGPGLALGEGGAAGRQSPQEDRKSTRLNSSHVRISYA